MRGDDTTRSLPFLNFTTSKKSVLVSPALGVRMVTIFQESKSAAVHIGTPLPQLTPLMLGLRLPHRNMLSELEPLVTTTSPIHCAGGIVPVMGPGRVNLR